MGTKHTNWHIPDDDPWPVRVTIEYPEGHKPKLWTDQFGPPNDGDNVATRAGEFDDDIKELGNKIVALNMRQASELSRYLGECGMEANV